METPDFVKQVLAKGRGLGTAFPEYRLAGDLDRALKDRGDIPQAERSAWWAEMAAFRFQVTTEGRSSWGTSFGPWASVTYEGGKVGSFPEPSEIDEAIIDYWRRRADEEAHPILKARYSHLVWDLSPRFSSRRPNIKYLKAAIDGYLEAVELASTEESQAVIAWLGRTLHLATAANQTAQVPGIVAKYFFAYPRIVDPNKTGTWPFVFDDLYENRVARLTQPQVDQIIQWLEDVLASNADTDPKKLNPWGAQEAAKRLAKHYKKVGKPDDATRVLSAAARSFEAIAKPAGAMTAMSWLDTARDLYQEAGLIAEAKKAQIESSGKAAVAHLDMKPVDVAIEVPIVEFKQFLDSLTSSDLDAALVRIAIEFCPSVDAARSSLRHLREHFAFQAHIGIQIHMDRRAVGEVGSLDDDPEGRLIYQLAQSLDLALPFLQAGLQHVRQKLTPNINQILDFLGRSPIFDADRRGILETGLKAYLDGRYVEAIHVLVPQIEHVIRTMLAYCRISPNLSHPISRKLSHPISP